MSKQSAKRKAATNTQTSKQDFISETVLLTKLYPNEEQARKLFDQNKLQELANSIKQQGLMNPIVVRPDGKGKYMIVAGERRYRACTLLNLKKVPVIIRELNNEQLTCQMIIENLQREDITALEEARAFKKAMDDFNLDVNQLSYKLGISQPHRISDRLSLLNLKSDYQDYLAQNILSPTQAFYLSKVPVEYQDSFWRLIRSGKVDSASLAATAQGYINQANQNDMFPDTKLSAEEVKTLRTMEKRMEQVFTMVSNCFNDECEIDVLKKIDPSKASTYADKIKIACRTMQLIEKHLREPAARQRVLEEVSAA